MARERKRPARLGRGLSSLMSRPAKVSPVTGSGDGAEEADAQPGVVAAASEVKSVGESAAAEQGLHYLPVESLRANPHQPRQHFDEASLRRLADSIVTDGLMQPIVVRQSASDGGDGPVYELVAGERRWRAAKLAGLASVPAVVRELDDRQLAEWALIENLQREDLNPLERAEAFQRLSERFGLSHDDIAARVGMDRSSVSNLLRLLSLDDAVQQMVRAGRLSMGQARALAGVSDMAVQRQLAQVAVRQDLSVRQLEQRVRTLRTDSSSDDPAATRRVRSAYLQDLEQQIAEQLATKVRIRPGRKKGSGTLSIDFYSLDQFDALLSRLGVQTD